MGILTTEPKTANMLKHKPQIIKGIVTKLTPPSFEAPRTPWTIPFSSYVSMELCLDLEAKMKQRKKKEVIQNLGTKMWSNLPTKPSQKNNLSRKRE